MGKKSLIVLIVFLAIIVIATIVVFVAMRSQPPSTGTGTQTGTLPAASSTFPVGGGGGGAAPTGPTITLGTSEGNVTVDNFYQTAATTTPDGQTVVLQDQPDYMIVYNTDDSSFIISVLAAPLEQSREAAEAALLAQLGISKTDACKLKVSEGVPIYASDEYPGVNFPLSFCGTSTPM